MSEQLWVSICRQSLNLQAVLIKGATKGTVQASQLQRPRHSLKPPPSNPKRPCHDSLGKSRPVLQGAGGLVDGEPCGRVPSVPAMALRHGQMMPCLRGREL